MSKSEAQISSVVSSADEYDARRRGGDIPIALQYPRWVMSLVLDTVKDHDGLRETIDRKIRDLPDTCIPWEVYEHTAALLTTKWFVWMKSFDDADHPNEDLAKMGEPHPCSYRAMVREMKSTTNEEFNLRYKQAPPVFIGKFLEQVDVPQILSITLPAVVDLFAASVRS